MTTPLSHPNLTTFEEDHSAYGGLADRVKLALRVPDTRDKVVNYYSKLVGWSIDHKRAAKDAATDLFDKLSSLEPPSDHLAHLLAALARTGRDGALVQDIEKATRIIRRAEKDSANNDGLHYHNKPVVQPAPMAGPSISPLVAQPLKPVVPTATQTDELRNKTPDEFPNVPPGNDYEYDGELSDVARKLKPDQQALEALEVAKKAVQAHFAHLNATLQVKLTGSSHLNHLAKVCVLDSAGLEVVGSVRNQTCVGTADLDVLVPFNLPGHPVEIDGQSPTKVPYVIADPDGNVELKKANIRSLLDWFNDSMKSFLRSQLPGHNGSFTLKDKVKDLDTVITHQSASPKNVVYPLEFTFGGVTIDVDIVPIFRGSFGKFCMIYTDSTLQLAQHTIAASHIDAVSEALKGDVIDMIKFLKHLLKLDPLRPVVAGHTLKLPSCTMESAVMLSAQREGTRWWANNRSFLVRFRDSLNIIHHRLIHKRALASPSNPFGNVLEWFMEDGAAHNEMKRWLEFYLRLNDNELLSLAKCTSQ